MTHIGAYGIPYDPYGGAGGALAFRLRMTCVSGSSKSPELIAVQREKGAELIQVNHPRASQGYFDHVEYGKIPIENLDPEIFTTDFDTVEIFNSPNYFCRNFQDWQGLLNQGLQVRRLATRTRTASSKYLVIPELCAHSHPIHLKLLEPRLWTLSVRVL